MGEENLSTHQYGRPLGGQVCFFESFTERVEQDGQKEGDVSAFAIEQKEAENEKDDGVTKLFLEEDFGKIIPPA